MTTQQVAGEVNRRLATNIKAYCPTCDAVKIAFFNMKKTGDRYPGVVRRRLLQTANDAVYDGTVTVVFSNAGQQILFDEMYRSLLDTSYSASLVPLTPEQLSDAITSGQILLIDATQVYTSNQLALGSTTYIHKGVANNGYTSWQVYQVPANSTTNVSQIMPVPTEVISFNDFLDVPLDSGASTAAKISLTIVTIFVGFIALFVAGI